MTQSQEPHGQEDEKPAQEEDRMGTPHSAPSEADAETETIADEADPVPEQSSTELSPDEVIADLQAQIAALKGLHAVLPRSRCRWRGRDCRAQTAGRAPDC